MRMVILCMSISIYYITIKKQIRLHYLQVVDLSTGEALGENELGEICVRGPHVMKGNRVEFNTQFNTVCNVWHDYILFDIFNLL